MFDSVHVHMLLHELNLHCWDLLDDLPSPISGTASMLTTASHQSSQQAAARDWSLAFALAASHSAQPPG